MCKCMTLRISILTAYLYLPDYLYPYLCVCTYNTKTHTHILPVFLSLSIMKLLDINEKALNYTLKLFLDVIINHCLKIIPLHIYFNMHIYVYVYMCVLIFSLSMLDTNKLLRIIGMAKE